MAPNITDFDAGNLALHPSETGVESVAAAGRRLGGFYNQQAEALARTGSAIGRGIAAAGDTAVNYMDHQQINAGADHASKMWANLQDSWNQTTAGADPHDPSVAKKWREEVLEPTLDQFAQGFTTQKSQNWANERTNSLRQHFFTTTEADMSRLASVSVSNTVHNMGNNYTNAVMKDPSAVTSVLDQVDHSIDGVLAANPNIKGPDAAKVKLEVGEKLKEQVVKAAVQGAILNGGGWQKIADKYPQYVDGAELKMFARAAQVQDRANLAYSKQAEAYQRQIDRDNVEQARNDIWAKNVTVDQTGRPTINPDFFKRAVEIPMKYPNAPNATETARTLLDWGERMQKPEKAVTDPQTDQNLTNRMFAADNPTSELDVLKAEAAGKLDTKYGSILKDLIRTRDSEPIKTPIFKAATDQAKIAIEGVTPADKAFAGGKYAAFMQQFLSEYLKQSRAGTLQPNALDLNDDKSLISQYLAPYRMDLGGIVKNNGGVGSIPVTPPPKPAPIQPGVPTASM